MKRSKNIFFRREFNIRRLQVGMLTFSFQNGRFVKKTTPKNRKLKERFSKGSFFLKFVF